MNANEMTQSPHKARDEALGIDLGRWTVTLATAFLVTAVLAACAKVPYPPVNLKAAAAPSSADRVTALPDVTPAAEPESLASETPRGEEATVALDANATAAPDDDAQATAPIVHGDASIPAETTLEPGPTSTKTAHVQNGGAAEAVVPAEDLEATGKAAESAEAEAVEAEMRAEDLEKARKVAELAEAKAIFERQQRLEAEAEAAARIEEAKAETELERQRQRAAEAKAVRETVAPDPPIASTTVPEKSAPATSPGGPGAAANDTRLTRSRSDAGSPPASVAVSVEKLPDLPPSPQPVSDGPGTRSIAAPESGLAPRIASAGQAESPDRDGNPTLTSEASIASSLALLEPATGSADGPANSFAGADMTVSFSQGSDELSVEARNQLFELAQRLQEEAGVDVQLFGYAAGLNEGPSRARRLSLTRLMAVRGFLIRQGIERDTLDGRAMGEDLVAGETTDRVDILIVRQ